MRFPVYLSAGAALLMLLACGGGSSSSVPPATALVYTDPTDPAQWRLVKDATSTPTHLVLDLMAPAGVSGMGVTLILNVDGSRATWGDAMGAGLLKAGGYQGVVARCSSLQGSALRILLSQVNPTPPLVYGSAPVLTVALDLGAGASQGNAALAASQGGHLPAPLTQPAAVTIQTGTLTAQ